MVLFISYANFSTKKNYIIPLLSCAISNILNSANTIFLHSKAYNLSVGYMKTRLPACASQVVGLHFLLDFFAH